MKSLFKHGLEAVPKYPWSSDYQWLVRPRHPDGEGYAPITHIIPRKLAELWADAANNAEDE